MANQALLDMLQNDLKNERKHMNFYLYSAAVVQGLHRAEIGEFLLEEANSELAHVHEFSKMVVYLGGVPNMETNIFPIALTDVREILQYASDMEEEVATTYAKRLEELEKLPVDSETAVLKVFYEDQIKDSWATAREVKQMLLGAS